MFRCRQQFGWILSARRFVVVVAGFVVSTGRFRMRYIEWVSATKRTWSTKRLQSKYKNIQEWGQITLVLLCDLTLGTACKNNNENRIDESEAKPWNWAQSRYRPGYGPTWYKAHNVYVVFRLMPAKRSICCNSIHAHLQTKITITVHLIGHRSLQFSWQPVRITVLLTSLWGNELPEVFLKSSNIYVLWIYDFSIGWRPAGTCGMLLTMTTPQATNSIQKPQVASIYR